MQVPTEHDKVRSLTVIQMMLAIACGVIIANGVVTLRDSLIRWLPGPRRARYLSLRTQPRNDEERR